MSSLSQHSFTLSEDVRELLLRGNTSQSNSGHDCPTSDVNSVKGVEVSRTSAASAIPIGMLFDHSYSQEFSQTQEDPASLRQQVDVAPVIQRDTHSLPNIFDPESSQVQVEHTRDVDEDEYRIPSSPLCSVPADPPSSVPTRIPETTVKSTQLPRLQELETPQNGLTQFFSTSQDTPVLAARKSRYVSIGEESGHDQTGEPNSSDEDDPDFPKIRREDDNHSRQRAHKIMDRLRDRARDPASHGVLTGTGAAQRELSDQSEVLIVANSQPSKEQAESIPTQLSVPNTKLPNIVTDEISFPAIAINTQSTQGGDRFTTTQGTQTSITSSPIHRGAKGKRKNRKSVNNSILEMLDDPTPEYSTRTSQHSDTMHDADQPRKRIKVDHEVDETVIPPQSCTQDSTIDRSDPSRRTTNSHSISRVSSPLTSLASDDFIQHLSPILLRTPKARYAIQRVLAPAQAATFYRPAICLTEIDHLENHLTNPMLDVRFDNNETARLPFDVLRPFSLQAGDVVRVDVTGLRKHNYIVTSSYIQPDRKVDETAEEHFNARRSNSEQICTFKTDQLYIPNHLMKPFLQRSFKSNPSEPTTPSRRQAIRLAHKVISPSISIHSEKTNIEGIFTGIAFSITFQNPDSRTRIERRIRAHGGIILDTGPQELFSRVQFADDNDIDPWTLSLPAHKLLGTVVIADQYSRRSKYLQALALRIPCLHFSYIDDCILRKRIIDLHHYLLASGVAKFGQSEGVLSMRPLLDDLSSGLLGLRERSTMLYGKNIIVVLGVTEEEARNRRIHLFLAWAMGCNDLCESDTFESARKVMMSGLKNWHFINVQEVDAEMDLTGRLMTNEDVVQSLIRQTLQHH